MCEGSQKLLQQSRHYYPTSFLLAENSRRVLRCSLSFSHPKTGIVCGVPSRTTRAGNPMLRGQGRRTATSFCGHALFSLASQSLGHVRPGAFLYGCFAFWSWPKHSITRHPRHHVEKGIVYIYRRSRSHAVYASRSSATICNPIKIEIFYYNFALHPITKNHMCQSNIQLFPRKQKNKRMATTIRTPTKARHVSFSPKVTVRPVFRDIPCGIQRRLIIQKTNPERW